MRSRRLLAGLFGLAACVTLTAWSAAQDRTRASDTKGAHMQHQHYWDCAKACDDCARMCDACGAHCLHLVAEGRKEHLETARTCQDCSSVCIAAGAVTARSGPFSETICNACADACKRCGDACEKHKDDPMMKNCAAECRKCEQACREMVKHTGHGAERK